MAGGLPSVGVGVGQSMTDAWFSWATQTLNAIGAPTNQNNLNTLFKWSVKESGQAVMRWNNPLNTTQNAAGAVSQNSVGVKSYPDIGTGVRATAQTLTNGRYPNIVNALRQGIPASSWGSNPAIASELQTWGSGTNWFNWSNTPGTPSANFQSTTNSPSNSSPITDALGGALNSALGSALGPIGSAITGAEQSFVAAATNITLMAFGGLLMLGGLALLAFAISRTPAVAAATAGPRQLVGAAANLTPQGRAVSTAKAVSAKPAETKLSPNAQAALAAAKAGRGSKLTPEVKAELRAQEKAS